jgi:3-oxoacyl-[acyl-carrier protein] reductase
MQLGKKVVVITGAGRGIGRAMALAFADRGADIAALDLDAAALAETRALCEAKGVRTRTHAMDVTVESQVIKTFDAVVAELRRFDVLVNNAGITRDALLVKAQDGAIHSKMSLAQWQAVIDVNLTGVFLCGREGAERMIQLGNGGLIVNVSSISREGNPGQTNYSAAKAGVAAMTVTWAKELARYGIRSAAIAPGFCSTEILAAMKPEMLARVKAAVPLHRLGEPAEIAATAVFMAENDFVTGRVIEVDGGLRL